MQPKRRRKLRLKYEMSLKPAASAQPIIGIAFACGFESLTTFNHGFRLAFGLSPSELRDGASTDHG